MRMTITRYREQKLSAFFICLEIGRYKENGLGDTMRMTVKSMSVCKGVSQSENGTGGIGGNDGGLAGGV